MKRHSYCWRHFSFPKTRRGKKNIIERSGSSRSNWVHTVGISHLLRALLHPEAAAPDAGAWAVPELIFVGNKYDTTFLPWWPSFEDYSPGPDSHPSWCYFPNFCLLSKINKSVNEKVRKLFGWGSGRTLSWELIVTCPLAVLFSRHAFPSCLWLGSGAAVKYFHWNGLLTALRLQAADGAVLLSSLLCVDLVLFTRSFQSFSRCCVEFLSQGCTIPWSWLTM